MQSLHVIKEAISEDSNNEIMLSRSLIADPSKILKSDIEADVLEAAKKGNYDFLGIVLETGIEDKILTQEKDAFELFLKYKIHAMECQLIDRQKTYISDYNDGERTPDLKQLLHNRLTRLIDMHVDEAIEMEKEAIVSLNERNKFYKKEPGIYNVMKAHYLNHFSQHEIPLPIERLSFVLETLRLKLNHHADLSGMSEYEYSKLVNLTQETHIKFDSINSAMKSNFLFFITMPGYRIPLTYQYDRNDNRAIDRFLSIKISPNLIEPETGDTLLHIAIANDKITLAQLLIGRCADPLIRNKAGISALDLASKASSPEYFDLITNSLKLVKSSKNITTPIDMDFKDILDKMTYFKDAREVLNDYSIKLNYRKRLSLFIRIIMLFEKRLDSRLHDFGHYHEILRLAEVEHDPYIFFSEVEKLWKKAERGLRGKSQLHDELNEIRERFVMEFDHLRFRELKKKNSENSLSAPNSASSSPINGERKQTETLKDVIREQSEKIATLESEFKKINDKLSLRNSEAKQETRSSPKSTSFFSN